MRTEYVQILSAVGTYKNDTADNTRILNTHFIRTGSCRMTGEGTKGASMKTSQATRKGINFDEMSMDGRKGTVTEMAHMTNAGVSGA